jgi:uncharacterized membrane protein
MLRMSLGAARVLVLAALASAAFGFAGTARAATIVDLGANFVPTSLNNQDVVAGNTPNNDSCEIWQGGTTTPLGLAGSFCSAKGVNDSGTVVGSANAGVFTWKAPGPATILDPGGFGGTSAGIDTAGRTAFYQCYPSPCGPQTNPVRGFYVLPGGSPSPLPGSSGPTNYWNMQVSGIGNAGIVGDYLGNPVFWPASAGGYTGPNPIDVEPRFLSRPINNVGDIVGQNTNSFHNVLRVASNGSETELGTLSPQAVNDSDQVVGSDNGHAALWAAGTKTDLNTLVSAGSGWVLQSAVNINDNGDVVGTGTLNGVSHGFLLKGDKRTTATSVRCLRGAPPLSEAVSCVATVHDTDTPPASVPGGVVQFSASGGSFPAGSTCTLRAAGSDAAYCTVSYWPPGSGPGAVPVGGAYKGDAKHAASSGAATTVIATPVDDGTCRKLAAGGGKASRLARRRPAHMSINQRESWTIAPNGSQTTGDYVYFCGARFFTGARFLAGETLGGAMVALGGATALGGFFAPDPEPATKTVIVVGTRAVGGFVSATGVWVMSAVNDDVNASLKDPPDAAFRTLAAPARMRAIRLKSGAGLSGPAAVALQRLLNAERRFGALSLAYVTTLNRVGGAIQANDRVWTRRQATAAIAYAGQLAGQSDSVVTLLGRAAKLAAHSSVLSRRFSARSLARLRGVVRHGLPARWTRTLRLLNFNAAQLAALRSALGRSAPRGAPRSVAAVLGDPRLSQGFRDLATALRLYTQIPSVQALAKS